MKQYDGIIRKYDRVVRNEPGLRRDVVERARRLAADPSYPPVAVIRQIAGRILESPDLGEDEG